MSKSATLDPIGVKEGDSKSLDKGGGMKRYNLVIPEVLFNEVQKIADEEHTTVVDLLRRFIKLGLIATDVSRKADSALVIREGNREREIMFLT